MQQVSVPVINNTDCENMYRRAGYVEHIPNIFICAGYADGKRDSCEVRKFFSHFLLRFGIFFMLKGFRLLIGDNGIVSLYLLSNRVTVEDQWSFKRNNLGCLRASFLGVLGVQRPINPEFTPGSASSANGSTRSSSSKQLNKIGTDSVS